MVYFDMPMLSQFFFNFYEKMELIRFSLWLRCDKLALRWGILHSVNLYACITIKEGKKSKRKAIGFRGYFLWRDVPQWNYTNAHAYHLNRKHKQLNLRDTFYVKESYTFKYIYMHTT